MGNIQGTSTSDGVVPAMRQIDEVNGCWRHRPRGHDSSDICPIMHDSRSSHLSCNQRTRNLVYPVAHEIRAGLFGIVDD